jgi:2-phosphosulfolactate phosphatase
VIAALLDHWWADASPEAETAAAAWRAVAEQTDTALADRTSGRELTALGYPHDVTVAAENNTSTSVPVLRAGSYTAS